MTVSDPKDEDSNTLGFDALHFGKLKGIIYIKINLVNSLSSR